MRPYGFNRYEPNRRASAHREARRTTNAALRACIRSGDDDIDAEMDAREIRVTRRVTTEGRAA